MHMDEKDEKIMELEEKLRDVENELREAKRRIMELEKGKGDLWGSTGLPPGEDCM